MSELEPQRAPADPIQSLHRMSTTAGVGSQEYVAINAFAVVAIVTGLGSLLAIVSWEFLALAIVAAVCALLALWQIAHSNGTQGGRAMAVIGLVLALASGGFTVKGQWTAMSAQRAAEREISQVTQQLTLLICAGQHAEAYKLFSADFRSTIPFPQFQGRLQAMTSNPIIGPVERITTSGHLKLIPGADATIHAITQAQVKYEKAAAPDRFYLKLRRTGVGPWLIYDFEMFDPPSLPQD